MVQKRNFRAEQEHIIKNFDGDIPPRLLLHSCCAPCSSAVLEYLAQYMSITVFYFNPNIFPEEEFLEGGERCFSCYRLRLEETAKLAAEQGYDFFTTTLSVSPYKNAAKLNEIGEELAEKYGVRHLPSDFKKKDGYKRSIELSAEYGLYRQNYCGCVYSKAERENANKKAY